ncbi:MAG: hypothetical protein HFJ91_08785 [Muribaculaceae bacterium]|nr:hypothetical protein [Muribaculaceae bacterium]
MSNTKMLPHNGPDWKGYTLDELRYMRAYTAARIEISKNRLAGQASNIKKNGLGSATPGGGSIASRIIGAFGYIDMALIGWRIGKMVFRTARLFKKR